MIFWNIAGTLNGNFLQLQLCLRLFNTSKSWMKEKSNFVRAGKQQK
jgi:hypothetical protein